MFPQTQSDLQNSKFNNFDEFVKQNTQSQEKKQENNSFIRFQTYVPEPSHHFLNNLRSKPDYPQQQLNSTQIKNEYKQQTISKNKYDDDEQIEEQAKQSFQKFDLDKELIFEIKTLRKMIQLSKTQNQYLPGIISIKTKDQTNEQDLNRIGVDLICLIDKSSSMQGRKIDTVKSSLKVLLNFLTDQDRLSLIVFNDKAQRLTPLKRTTQNNKQYFLSIFEQIVSTGGTSIASSTEIAFEQLKTRKYRNNVSSIFLLSDGQDPDAIASIEQQLKLINEELPEFTIHSFGFGEDHDAIMMTSICNLKHGSFYFVQNINLLDEFFVEAFGGLKSVVGEKLQITVTLQPQTILKDLKIFKTYGNMWTNKGNYYEIDLPILIQGSRKDFVFELELPRTDTKIQDDQRNPQIIDVKLQITDPISKIQIEKRASLVLTIFQQDEQINQNEEDEEVLTQYNRVIAAQVIDNARKSCQQQEYQKAQNNIDNLLVRFQTNQKFSSQNPQLIQDLQQAKQASTRQTFNSYGQGQMMQISSNSYKQQGVNSVFSPDGQQQQQNPRFQTFSNNLQSSMVNTLQLRKTQNQIGN
ncbi:unnamed protein product [Paramecium sonneborni]|uniref:VWFA domain-containing protein n=1 Tax=Paramecium sonneborni TaxID=65129 RepID=A0A8S1R4H8_9CILI|nr:unnamed protein product [Paramecium sonneborni]